MQHTHGATSRLRPRHRQQAALHYLLLALALVSISSVAQARIIGDSDPEVQYTPSELASNICIQDPFNEGCKDRWWSEPTNGAYKGAVKATGGPNASLQVSFRGSQIQVRGVKTRRGANAFVSIDGGSPLAITTDLKDDQTLVDVVLYTMPGLDPNVTHTLKIVYDSNSAGRKHPHLLRIDSFDVTEGPSGGVGFPPPAASTNSVPATTVPPFSSAPPGATVTQTSDGAGLTDDPNADNSDGGSKSSSTPTVPIVAGLSTGLATLVIASAVLFFLLRRRRAIRVQSMHLPRTVPSPGPNMSMVRSQSRRIMYPFTRRGSSTAGSSDTPRPPPPAPPPTQPLPPVPQINTYVSPYTYQRPHYPRSDDSSSIGLPVDERPPNIPDARLPLSPIAQSPRVLRVYNPDGSTVVSSGDGH